MEDLRRYYTDHNQAESAGRAQPETDYYAHYAQQYAQDPKAIMWNWSAALFGVEWLLFRKAYRAAFIAFAAQSSWAQAAGLIVTSLAPSIPHAPPTSLSALVSALLVLCIYVPLFLLGGLYGNRLYFWDLKQRARKNSRATGTSWWPVILWNVGVLALALLVHSLGLPLPAPAS